jgi:predicted amidohydrolase
MCKMIVTSIPMNSICNNTSANITCLENHLANAHNNKCELAIFPEMNISGYITDRHTINDFIDKSSELTTILCKLSLQYKIAFTSGWPINEDGKYYIAQFIFADGEIKGCHRKTHLTGSEILTFTPANKIEVFKLGDISIAMQLCIESHFPEISYMQAKKGADIIAIGFASPRESSEEKLARFNRFIPARAYDNGCFVVVTNQSGLSQTGKKFAPVSIIYDAKGIVLSQSTENPTWAKINTTEIKSIKESRMGWFNGIKREEIFTYGK